MLGGIGATRPPWCACNDGAGGSCSGRVSDCGGVI